MAALGRDQRRQLARQSSNRRAAGRVVSGKGMKRATAVCAVLLTPLVWPAGILALWVSAAWTRRDKIIGSLLPPGGFALAWLIATQVRSACPAEGPGTCEMGAMYGVLHPGPPGFDHVFGAAVFVIAVVLPLLTAGYLALRLRARWSSL